mmetsp:Transcript_5429/g.17049  ORF Transcript_5429/g.17049 Transcript_5429/m.17049 type:complete len:247 (-) Transcript_5429:100-840(-)
MPSDLPDHERNPCQPSVSSWPHRPGWPACALLAALAASNASSLASRKTCSASAWWSSTWEVTRRTNVSRCFRRPSTNSGVKSAPETFPTIGFSGSGGMMRPGHLPTSCVNSQSKSRKRRLTWNSAAEYCGSDVRVVTLYAMYACIPSPCRAGSVTVTWKGPSASAVPAPDGVRSRAGGEMSRSWKDCVPSAKPLSAQPPLPPPPPPQPARALTSAPLAAGLEPARAGDAGMNGEDEAPGIIAPTLK